ncbi:MAG: hypothetical protein AAFX50_08900 [Acidobacteriota bacterium]
MMKKALLGLAVFGLLGSGAAAAESAAVGQKAASIEAKASDGQDYASSQVLSGDKRLVLVFFRGAW